MGRREIHVFLLIAFALILVIYAETDPNDFGALSALKSSWQNLPPSWEGSDPCGSSWEGINCSDSHVTSITLGGMGVAGSQFSDITSLTALQTLDLSNNRGLKGILPSTIGNLKNLSTLILIGCSFFGPIPDSIGSLQQLVFLSLNSNNFSGSIPPSIGKLSRLSWLDLSENNLDGEIPVSIGTKPGLDWLIKTRHFHLSKNRLSGIIQPRLFSSNMSLIHVILDHNKLHGDIPSTLGSMITLEMVRLDSNSLSGPVPPNLNNLTNLNELYLSNNNLSGSLPDLTGMRVLSYVDMSNNNFTGSDVPSWFTSLQSLTTLLMEQTQLQGEIPSNLFSLPQLETVVLSNNNLTGTLDLGTRYSNNLTLDLQNNSITDFAERTGYNADLILVDNPICEGNGARERYCSVQKPNSSFLTTNNCTSVVCSSGKILSPNCICGHPYTGTLHFFSYSFSNLENITYFRYLAGTVMAVFRFNQLPVDSVSLDNPSFDAYSFLQIELQIFPSGQDHFNRTSTSSMGFLLNRQVQLFQNQSYYGPFYFIERSYCCFDDGKKSSKTGIIIGSAIGGSVLVLLLLVVGAYAFHQRKKAKKAVKDSNPFASWDPNRGNGGVPQLKGARWFSFEELSKCTNNFSEANGIGSGGYGKVYKGTLASGQLVAIKRAQQGSLQGAHEFKTEIELLSRIHHKNVVSLVGFCYDHGEQMLVYEYIPNGTLKESLSGKSGIRMEWTRRLKIALDSARGLLYLHELADPPIIHRDIKSNNILLDNHLIAKVADFGLSKLLGDADKGYVTTQVKGTLGYMDPEYYMTQQLTEKSDVYGFGVVLLELITARAPIARGKYIVRIVQEAIESSKDSDNNLHEILDPVLSQWAPLGGLNKFVDLAMRCVKESSSDRPTMGEVVREIENVMQMASAKGSNEIEFNSASFEGSTTAGSRPNSFGSKAFDYSGGFLPFNAEHPK